jgi:transposase
VDTKSEAICSPWKDVHVPRPHPPEFRQRAVELALLGEKPIGQIAKDLGISDSCLRDWIKQADVDSGRRETRTLKLENEILKRAAAYFARENVLPK